MSLAHGATTLSRDAILLTKSGSPKKRFKFDELVQLLDLRSSVDQTLTRLKIFQQLFAFRRCNGIITRSNQGPKAWTALRGPLTLSHIVRHLLANSLPTKLVQWVGARCFGTSKFLCLDVDSDRLQGTKTNELVPAESRKTRLPLEDRRIIVENALERMGVDPRDRNEVLLQRTPSGGLHYYLFLDLPYFIDDIHGLLIAAGLHDAPGQIEFFPSPSRALRLPFGLIPDRPHNPNSWVRFIDRYRFGDIKRHTLPSLFEKLDATRVNAGRRPGHANHLQDANPTEAVKSLDKQNSGKKPRPTTFPLQRSMKLSGDAKLLWERGIEAPGTRTEVLKKLAADLIWKRGVSADEATTALTTWAMNRRHKSVDVEYDLDHGTNKVEAQIGHMCRWYEQHQRTRTKAPNQSRSTATMFTANEINALRPKLSSLPPTEREPSAKFILSFLRFAKQHGGAATNGLGWDSTPSVKHVIRRWPGCHHMHYKTRIAWATDCGLLTMTKDKWQPRNRPGRARTYRINLTPEPLEAATLDFDAALNLLTSESVDTS